MQPVILDTDVASLLHRRKLTGRLTFTGLLLCQEQPVHTRFGPMRLRGWDCESTAWLRLPDSARLGERRHVS